MDEAYIREVFAKKKNPVPSRKRAKLTPQEREEVLAKTSSTCHVCGCKLGAHWQADHVIPCYWDGDSEPNNYLPICRECNRLRWSYSPETIRLMLIFGRYAKEQIRADTTLGKQLIELALKHERHRKRKPRKH